MQKTPSAALIKLDEVRNEINKSDYDKSVNHSFITNQFTSFFDDAKLAKSKLETFKANYLILISDKDIAKTIEKADKFAVIQSLINLSKDNLSINPYDKEACVVNYGGKIIGMPMAKGKIKRMQEKGAIKYIDLLEVVYDCDKITNVNGRYTFSKNLTPPDKVKRIGVLLIAIMTDGNQRHKFVTMKDVELRRTHAPSKAIWDKWTDEMYRKTAINIFEKEIGVTTLLYSEFHEEEPIQQDEQVSETTEQETAEDIPHEDIIPESIVDPNPESDILAELSEKKQELENKIKSNPGILKSGEIDQLKEIIDTLDMGKLQAWIDAINKRIEKQRSNNEPQI